MKKNIIAILATMLPFFALGQGANYKVSIKLSALKTPAKAYLVVAYGWTNQRVIDSATASNGEFFFSGQDAGPLKTSIVLDHSGTGSAKWVRNADVKLLYIEKGDITISGTDSIQNAKISGSKTNVDYDKYYAQVLAPADRVSATATATFKAATAEQQKDKAFVDGVLAKMRVALKQRDSLKYIYIKQNPNSFLSLEALAELGGAEPDVAKIQPMFKTLAPGVRDTKAGKDLAKLLNDTGPTAVGSMAPIFAQNDVNDQLVKLTDFKGKYVLLDFWASWCGPCRAENPNVVKAYEKYKDKNFTVLGVSLDQAGKKDLWLAAIKKDGLPWTQVSDLQYWNNAAAKLYGINSIPKNFLIDPNGKIVAKNLRGEDLNQKLAQLLK